MNDFSIIIPLSKSSNNSLTGIASATSVDRDEEQMSSGALTQMVAEINAKGVNLFGNHEHSWENTLGVVKAASKVDGQMNIQVDLDDPVTNPKIPMLLNKLKAGIKLGLSVGGNVTGYSWEYNRQLGKKIKVLDGVKVYEISVVGIPSNADSYLGIPGAIAKSAKLPGLRKCPNCLFETNEERCDLCLTQL
jgi:HK97 family phage prohead protease